MRLMPLAATGLLAAAILSTPTAYAAGETCHGRAATVVGTPGQVGLQGTEAADVIVTNGATSVSALGGDDLVCMTVAPPSLTDVRFDAGAGDDVVDASAATSGVSVELGEGRDTYTGAATRESVHGGTDGYDGAPRSDTERDVITTGAGGDDHVVSGSDPAVPNGDAVVLGADDGAGFGSGVGWFGPMADGARLDGGGGARLAFGVGPGSVVLDNAAGTLVEDGRAVLRWAGFDRFSVGGGDVRAPSSFTFVGTGRDEELDVRFDDAHTGRQLIGLGGGDDTLSLGHDDNLGARGSRYVGGAGTDHVNLWAGDRLELDLAAGRMETRKAGRTVRTRLSGFETQLVGARRLVLGGTKKSDELRFHACRATVRGRSGADDIRQSRGDDYFEGGLRCRPQVFRLFGGRGDDVMRGGLGRDLLVGGPGRDRIAGNGGRDRCSGERLRSCEVRLG